MAIKSQQVDISDPLGFPTQGYSGPDQVVDLSIGMRRERLNIFGAHHPIGYFMRQFLLTLLGIFTFISY